MSARPDAKDTASQTRFARALFDPDTTPPDDIARLVDGTAPAKRFSVYRNNVMVSLTTFLADTFPTVAALVGDEFFAAMAGVYIRQSPPTVPMLMAYGHDFPDFIAEFEPAQSVPYLADSARLDDAQRRAYHAADADPASPEDLARLAGEDGALMQLVLHPSLQLVRSPWPVLSIWEANRGEHSGDLPSHGEDVMVVRPVLDISVHALEPGVADFVTALADGMALGEAAGAAMTQTEAFDLTGALTFLITLGAIAGVRTDQRQV